MPTPVFPPSKTKKQQVTNRMARKILRRNVDLSDLIERWLIVSMKPNVRKGMASSALSSIRDQMPSTSTTRVKVMLDRFNSRDLDLVSMSA
jgi:hypothetical protein